jgi:hypothetical protein
MTYVVIRDHQADDEIAAFGRYAADYSDRFAREQFARLERVFSFDLAQSPHVSSYFYLTGAPYCAYLFRVGRRTAYWIVYTVDDAARRVNVLRFWHASANPDAFEI